MGLNFNNKAFEKICVSWVTSSKKKVDRCLFSMLSIRSKMKHQI